MKGKFAVLAALTWLTPLLGWAALSPQSEPIQVTQIIPIGTNVLVRWQGGVPPYKLQILRDPTGHAWYDCTYHIYTNEYLISASLNPQAMFRVRTIPDRLAPTLAGGLTVVPETCEAVSLYWSSAADNAGGTLLRGYRVYRNGNLLAELAPSKLAYLDHAVSASTTYGYELTAVDHALNESARTPLVNVTTPACVVSNRPPVAEAGADRTSGIGQVVVLNGLGSTDSDGSIVSYAWAFGDGTTGSGPTPAHIYQAPGIYQARLTVTDGGGATASDTATVTVTNQPPVARAGENRATPTNVLVNFSAATSSDADGSIASYAWNFGDGSTATGVTPSHAFRAAAIYTVRLTVTDNYGATGTATVMVTATNRPAVIVNQPPVARAGSNRVTATNVLVSFSGSTSSDPDGSIVSYAWNFGDGGTATGVAPSYPFRAAGNYTVRLTVTDNSGATGTTTIGVTATNRPPVNQPPVARAGGNRVTATNVLVSFSGSTSSDPDGSIASYAWNFGDGGTATGVAPSYAFRTAGNYTVRLTVTDNSGATGETTLQVTATNLPPANQSPVARAGTDRSVNLGQALSFDGSASSDADGVITSYQWNFGDGTAGSSAQVQHTFALAGVYTVTLTVTDNRGGSNSSTARVTVSGPAAAEALLAGLLPGLETARDVVVVGQTAYVAGDKFGLTVIDVTQPTAPRLIGVGNYPIEGMRLAVAGTRAVVTGWRRYYSVTNGTAQIEQVNGVYLFDITVATQPRLLGKLEDINYVFNGCELIGNYAYITAGSAGLLVVDLSNAAAPRIAATRDTPGYANSVTITNGLAYVADGSYGVTVLNVANPLAPSLVTTLDTTGNAKDVAISGTRAYVAATQYLLVLDLSNPRSPALRGSLNLQGAVRVKAENSKAYVAAGANGMVCVDANNPAAPVEISTQPPTGGPSATTLAVGLGTSAVYAANGGGGLGTMAKPSQSASQFSLLSTLATWNDGTQMTVKSGLGAVAFTKAIDGGPISWFGIRLFDLSIPQTPRLLGSFETNTFGFWQLAFSGDYLVAACGPAGLKIFDIHDPTAPALVATLPLPGSARGLVVSGTRVYVAAGTEGLRIVDLSNPRLPVALGSLALPGNTLSVAVEGSTAYVGGNTTFTVVDVSNPALPALRGSYAATATEVQVRQGLAYLAGTASGLIILDVSNSTRPALRGQVAAPSGSGQSTVSVFLSGTKAYVANSAGGLGIVNVANPAQPFYEEAVLSVGLARSVAVQGGWAFLSDSKATMISVNLGF